MKTLKNFLMIAIISIGFVACQEDDLPTPSGISTVPNSVNPVDAEFDEYRAQIKADLQDNALNNLASAGGELRQVIEALLVSLPGSNGE